MGSSPVEGTTTHKPTEYTLITWTIESQPYYNGTPTLAKVHVCTEALTTADLQGQHHKLLCGRRTPSSVLRSFETSYGVRIVKSWLGRPCKTCKRELDRRLHNAKQYADNPTAAPMSSM